MSTSTSSASRSRIELRYSVRLRRRNVSVRPGFGAAVAAASSEDSSHETTISYSRSSGRGDSLGGICREVSLRTTFSQASEFRPMSAALRSSSASPASLVARSWQSRQLDSMNRGRIAASDVPKCVFAACSSAAHGATSRLAANSKLDVRQRIMGKTPAASQLRRTNSPSRAGLRDCCHVSTGRSKYETAWPGMQLGWLLLSPMASPGLAVVLLAGGRRRHSAHSP